MNQFRAKRVDNNQWVFGDRVQGASGKMYIFDYDDINHTDLGIYEVIPETVGQFTGLTDKNGVKVFEGDKVLVHGKPYETVEPIVVTWGKKSYGWSLKYNCGKHYEKNPLIKYYSLPSSKNIEVIGNIHNKEVTNG